MIESGWMRFESTGSIADYLSYKGHGNDGYGGTAVSMAGRKERSRSVAEHGADHSADRHGVISSSGRGI